MIRLLEAAAADAPDRTAVVTPEGSPTYGELLDGARRVAAALRRRGISRFAVAEPDAAWVLRLLAGAALAGAEPCQYQPDTDAAELAASGRALGHRVCVTRRDDLGGSFDVLRPEDLVAGGPVDGVSGVDGVDGFGVDGVDRHGQPQPLPQSQPQPQPVMIRTTGTTGTPKAARHDWRVLAQTVAGLRPAPDERWLLAYGPHQFAGIQVLLHVVASQAALVAPFPRQPRDGLNALMAHDVTCASATPTFWRFLLAEARGRKVALPRLRQVTLGGEASPADLLEELRITFPGARVSQVYASTELGSITSVRDGLPGLAVDALWSETNPTANVRVEGGELWVRAAAGMLGYADDSSSPTSSTPPTSSTSSMRSAADAARPGAWRPTGDLVEVVGDRVLFRGRTSEVINVGGVKVHPLPVEERIAALDGVAVARVFGRPSALTGAIVAAEIVPAGGTDPEVDVDVDALRHAVKEAVADLPRAWQPRSLIFVDAIETRGGKTVRGVQA